MQLKSAIFSKSYSYTLWDHIILSGYHSALAPVHTKALNRSDWNSMVGIFTSNILQVAKMALKLKALPHPSLV